MTISGRNHCPDLGIVGIVGKGVQRGLHQLPFLDSCYIGFVHVDFDFVRFHVHDRGDSRARMQEIVVYQDQNEQDGTDEVIESNRRIDAVTERGKRRDAADAQGPAREPFPFQE